MNTQAEILLVEDNPNDMELTLRSLRRHHLANSVFVARDGAEALEYVFGTGRHAQRGAQNQPKIILLDLNLPKLNGIEVLRRLRDDQRTRRIPVVILTSSKEEQDNVTQDHLGVNAYIVKPVGFENFVRAVSEAGLYWMLLDRPPA
jgi:CheY-like chemotaxis protein